MCLRQNHELKHREPKPERDDDLENPLSQMREPPGALGDIIRRMKREAANGQGIREAGMRHGISRAPTLAGHLTRKAV